ncbi:MAG: hypothetical protein P8X68_09765 [Desulfobacterales bacterium]
MALTKSDIVAAVHELGFTKKKSVDIIETLLEIKRANAGPAPRYARPGPSTLTTSRGRRCSGWVRSS